MKQISGNKLFVKALKEEGVDVLFGYPGACTIDISDELYKQSGIDIILPRHEQALVHEADAYARTTGKVGVCLVTSGPGATNLVTGLATANYDSVPLVCFTGQVARHLIGNDAFQEVDIVGITRSITKYGVTVRNREDLGRIIKEAFYIARTGRPGPVLIDLPKDVMAELGSAEYPKSVNIRGYKPNTSVHIGQLKRALKMLQKAKKPLFLAGGGVIISRAQEIFTQVVEKTQIPVVTTVIAYLEKLRCTMQYLGVSDCKLQEGSMRADVNLSVREVGSETFGTRTEMKNLNSFKAIARAIEGERERQIELLEEGRAVVQETRRWDDNKESSHAMRSKEDAQDYRYFPDPDLPPIHISDAWIEELRASIPELREAKMERYQKEYELPAYDAGILTESRHLAGLFEETAVLLGNPKKAANWFMVEVLRLTKDKGLDPEKVNFTPKHLADLLSMVEKKEVSAQNAKKVFEKVFDEDIDPVVYIEENGLKIVEDTGLLTETVKKIVDANPGPLAELLGGKDKVMGFFVGQLMRELKGKANPDSVRKALAEEIERNKA